MDSLTDLQTEQSIFLSVMETHNVTQKKLATWIHRGSYSYSLNKNMISACVSLCGRTRAKEFSEFIYQLK